MKPICPYCSAPAQLAGGEAIYPHREDLFDLKFWSCAPCKAYVGCHRPNVGYGDGTTPLGRLANLELRAAKSRAHAAFDQLWKGGGYSRTTAYEWLAYKMGMVPGTAHIGEFDVEQCLRVVDVSNKRVREIQFRNAKRAAKTPG